MTVRPSAISTAPTTTMHQRRRRAGAAASPRAARRRRAARPSARSARRGRAGRIDAIAVTTSPTPYDQATVDQVTGNSARLRSRPNSAEQPAQPEREQVADAETDRRADAARPRAPRASTERLIWRREAPRARSSASSRLRWATRIEKVLMIRKMPTTRETPAKTSRNVSRKPRISSRDGLVLLDVVVAGLRHDAGGQHLLGGVGELLLGDAVGGVERDRGVDVLAVEELLLQERAVEDRQGGAVEAAGAELDEPGQLDLHRRRGARAWPA